MKKWVLLLISSACYIWLGYFTKREEFEQLFSIFSLLFLIYYLIIKQNHRGSQLKWWGRAGLLFRLSLVIMTPNLSDDCYRFIWDGRLLAQGYNPYLTLPSDHPQFSEDIFSLLNSPNYYTVYPPFNQLLFAVGAILFPQNILGHLIILRLEIILAEIGNAWLIKQLLKIHNLPAQNALLYILNPLVIIELTGNIHYEAVTIFFLLFSLFLYKQYQNIQFKGIFWSAISLGISVSVKLVPLVLLPLIIKSVTLRKGIIYSTIVAVIVVILFLPFLTAELINHFMSSLDLYFHKFEFNASIYYIVRWLGYQMYGYNIIGVAGSWLSLITVVAILWIAIKTKYSLFQVALLTLTIYFGMATTVHSWYITTLVMVSTFLSYRYAILWSYVVMLSYHLYHQIPYQENTIYLLIEYILVASMFVYEVKFKKKKYIDKQASIKEVSP